MIITPESVLLQWAGSEAFMKNNGIQFHYLSTGLIFVIMIMAFPPIDLIGSAYPKSNPCFKKNYIEILTTKFQSLQPSYQIML